MFFKCTTVSSSHGIASSTKERFLIYRSEVQGGQKGSDDIPKKPLSYLVIGIDPKIRSYLDHSLVSEEIIQAVRYALKQVDLFIIADRGAAVNIEGRISPFTNYELAPPRESSTQAKWMRARQKLLIEAIQRYLIESDEHPEITEQDYTPVTLMSEVTDDKVFAHASRKLMDYTNPYFNFKADSWKPPDVLDPLPYQLLLQMLKRAPSDLKKRLLGNRGGKRPKTYQFINEAYFTPTQDFLAFTRDLGASEDDLQLLSPHQEGVRQFKLELHTIYRACAYFILEGIETDLLLGQNGDELMERALGLSQGPTLEDSSQIKRSEPHHYTTEVEEAGVRGVVKTGFKSEKPFDSMSAMLKLAAAIEDQKVNQVTECLIEIVRKLEGDEVAERINQLLGQSGYKEIRAVIRQLKREGAVNDLVVDLAEGLDERKYSRRMIRVLEDALKVRVYDENHPVKCLYNALTERRFDITADKLAKVIEEGEFEASCASFFEEIGQADPTNAMLRFNEREDADSPDFSVAQMSTPYRATLFEDRESAKFTPLSLAPSQPLEGRKAIASYVKGIMKDVFPIFRRQLKLMGIAEQEWQWTPVEAGRYLEDLTGNTDQPGPFWREALSRYSGVDFEDQASSPMVESEHFKSSMIENGLLIFGDVQYPTNFTDRPHFKRRTEAKDFLTFDREFATCEEEHVDYGHLEKSLHSRNVNCPCCQEGYEGKKGLRIRHPRELFGLEPYYAHRYFKKTELVRRAASRQEGPMPTGSKRMRAMELLREMAAALSFDPKIHKALKDSGVTNVLEGRAAICQLSVPRDTVFNIEPLDKFSERTAEIIYLRDSLQRLLGNQKRFKVEIKRWSKSVLLRKNAGDIACIDLLIMEKEGKYRKNLMELLLDAQKNKADYCPSSKGPIIHLLEVTAAVLYPFLNDPSNPESSRILIEALMELLTVIKDEIQPKYEWKIDLCSE